MRINQNKIKLFNWLGINPSNLANEASNEFVVAVVNQRNYKSEEEIAEIVFPHPTTSEIMKDVFMAVR